jgi:hypothetical protein
VGGAEPRGSPLSRSLALNCRYAGSPDRSLSEAKPTLTAARSLAVAHSWRHHRLYPPDCSGPVRGCGCSPQTPHKNRCVCLVAMTIRFWRRSRRATLPLLWIGERGGKSACERCDGGDDREPCFLAHRPERIRLRLNAAMICARVGACRICSQVRHWYRRYRGPAARVNRCGSRVHWGGGSELRGRVRFGASQVFLQSRLREYRVGSGPLCDRLRPTV